MRENISSTYNANKADAQINGLIFGLLAGMSFAVAIWWYESYQLTPASPDLPRLIFIAGMPFYMLIGGLVGWLTARFANGLLGFVFWFLAGLCFGGIAGFVKIGQMEISTFYLLIGLLAGFGGLLESYFMPSTTRASSAFKRWFTLVALSMLVFIPMGLLTTNWINRSLVKTAQTPAVSSPLKGQGLTPNATLSSASNTPSSLSAVPRYAIELEIDYEAHTFQGHARLDYTNNENTPLNRLYFRLLPNGKGSYGDGSLTVTEVQVNNQPANTQLSQSDTVLEVTLSDELETGQAVQLGFEFNGLVPVDFGGDATPAGYGIYNFTDGVLALSAWYPTLAVYDHQGWNLDPVSTIGDSVYSDIAFYSVDVTTPDDIIVVATGVAVDRQESGNVTRHHFESGLARDFFLIMSPDFKVISDTVDGTTINSYYLPGHNTAGRQVLDVAGDSLQVFNGKIGPYPYSEFDLVEAPMRNALGVEFPGIVLIGSHLYDDPDDPSFTVTTAHEVAHQWFYNVVGNDVFDEPWLDEALATYVSSLYYEFGPAKVFPTGLIAYWQSRYEGVLQQGDDDLITQSLPYFEGLENSRVYGAVVYSKGALFFNELREEIGDQIFFEALQTYYQTYQYQIATGEDLLDVFEAATGRQLDDFYQEWLYSAGT